MMNRSVKCYPLTEAKGMEQIIEYIRLHPLAGIQERGALAYIDVMVAQLKLGGEQQVAEEEFDAWCKESDDGGAYEENTK
jgi:hypothetical protein